MIGSSAIIDAGIAIRLVLPNALQASCRKLISHLLSNEFEIVAPALWACETTSALCKAVYFGQITPDEGRRTLGQIAALGVRIVPPDDKQNRMAFEWTLRLKRAAAYDSYYLALMEHLECDLWTADQRLFNTAAHVRVHLVSERE